MKRLLIVVPVLILTGCFYHYSQGERVGVVFKYSRKGLFCKTWEGTANLGGMRAQTDEHGNSAMVPNVWEFTVADADSPRFNPIIQSAIESGATLKFSYDQEYFPICDSEDGNFVTDIKVLAK